MHINWNSSSVVFDGNRLILIDSNFNIFAITSKSLINRVINYFINHMVKACSIVGITNIHTWSFSNCFQTFKYFYGFGTIF